jgi:taurine dioxygenase
VSTPLKAAMLYAIEVPAQGGETIFANTAHVVNTMDAGLRERLLRLRVRHEFAYHEHYGSATSPVSAKPLRQAAERIVEVAEHPVIAKHPWSGSLYLTVNTLSSKRIVGVDEEESHALIAQINHLINQPANCYVHRWQKGDLIFWDNYLLQHARTPFARTEKRTLRRCQIAHELESESIEYT